MKLRPSRRLALLLAVAHGIALTTLWAGEIPLSLRVALAAAVVASLAWTLRGSGWIGQGVFPQRVRIVPSRQQGRSDVIELYSADDAMRSGEIVAGSFVAPYLTVVRFKTSPSKWVWPGSLVILPDSLDSETFRQLRVRLKWGGGEPA